MSPSLCWRSCSAAAASGGRREPQRWTMIYVSGNTYTHAGRVASEISARAPAWRRPEAPRPRLGSRTPPPVTSPRA